MVNQKTNNFGTFIQSDWDINEKVNILSGLRFDKHNMLDDLVFSPRISMMYKTLGNAQLRGTWSTGFRAPQAFDADLHMAFAGGGISRIILSDDLIQENSNSFSMSLNYDKYGEDYLAGFTFESFYTKLYNAFYQAPIGFDQFGDLFEKRNGNGATVKGVTMEMRVNYDKKIQVEGGYTIQSSMYEDPVENIEGLDPIREFIKTPNHYGYSTITLMPNNNFNSTFSLVYTGRMDMIHLGGSVDQISDEYFRTKQFYNIVIKSSYIINLDNDNNIELSAGVKNILNDYQNDFDTFKNRDSNFIYGPSMPRTFFIGFKYNLGN